MPSTAYTIDTRIDCARGFATLCMPTASVLLVTLSGDIDESIAPELFAVLADALRDSPRGTSIFWDLESLDWFDPAVRDALTRAAATRRGRTAGIHVLASAPWVRLGVSVAALALALDDVRVIGDRGLFERELAAARARTQLRTSARAVVAGALAYG